MIHTYNKNYCEKNRFIQKRDLLKAFLYQKRVASVRKGDVTVCPFGASSST